MAFHQEVSKFAIHLKKLLEDVEIEKSNLDLLANHIETLEDNANKVLRSSEDDDAIIDAQIILSVLTKTIEDNETSLLRAAIDHKEQSNADLLEIIELLCENDEEKDRILTPVSQISKEIV